MISIIFFTDLCQGFVRIPNVIFVTLKERSYFLVKLLNSQVKINSYGQ
jgi:hypothetical protein